MSTSLRSQSRTSTATVATVAATIVTVLLLGGATAQAQWAAQPGARVRNDFGPSQGEHSTVCRGACGRGCPSSCDRSVAYECVGGEALRRVEIHECGTHPGCREHDDCLDRCLTRQAAGFDCQAECHGRAIEEYGFEQATSWATGGGPYDGEPIVFEYTRDAPGAPEAAYRCPEGARRSCSGTAGRCLAAGGTEAEPIFDSYPDSAVRVTGFRAGRLCQNGTRSSVCEEAIDIRVTGEDLCDHGRARSACTRYGFEFDYGGADPSRPLLCSSKGAGEDFLGSLVAGALGSMPADRDTELGAALGQIQDQLASGSSLQDVLSGFSVTPNGEEEEATEPASPPPPPPPGLAPETELPAPSGHLVVPMYELADENSGSSILTREVRCTLGGAPVLETTFRLHFTDR